MGYFINAPINGLPQDGRGARNPWEFVFKLLRQGRDFDIDNDPLKIRELIEKSFQKELEI